MKLTSRPAGRADISRYPDYEGVSMKARVCEIDGEPAGILGIAFTRPYPCIFSDVSAALRPHLRSITVMRMVKWLRDDIDARSVPVMALAENDEPKAPGLLSRLGFAPVGEHEGHMVYERRPG